MNSKNLIYSIACLFFVIVIGAGIYEHIAVWPRAFDAPPASLTMLQGEYGLNAAPFWMMIHPVNLVLMIICLVVFWKSERKKNILVTIIGYAVILAVTANYFVPELLSITGTTFSNSTDASLTKRAGLWETLSIIRLGILIVLALVFLMGMTKPVSEKYLNASRNIDHQVSS